MGYSSRLDGEITIDPPLTWKKVKATKFGGRDSNHSLMIEVRETERDDDQGIVILREGIAIISAWEEEARHGRVEEELEQIVTACPGHTWRGELVRHGERANDIERYYVDGGTTVVSERAIVAARWPDGTPAPLRD